MELPCLLWDVDGTLTDSTELIADALEYVYQTYCHRSLPYEERRALIGTPLKKQIRVFGEPEAFGQTEQVLIDGFIAFYEANRERERILHPVLAVLIEGKRRGLPTALVTSKNREELANTLPRLEIADYLDATITADDIARPKPAPDGLLRALSLLQVAPEKFGMAVYIGDTVHDMEAARGAGVRGVGVTWGAAGRARLKIEAPAFLCDTPDDLRRLLFD